MTATVAACLVGSSARVLELADYEGEAVLASVAVKPASCWASTGCKPQRARTPNRFIAGQEMSVHRHLTFDMSGSLQEAQPTGGCPLDGGVRFRPHSASFGSVGQAPR